MHRSCVHVAASCHPCLNTDPFLSFSERERETMKRRSNVNARASIARFPYLLCPSPSPRRTDSSNRFSPATRRQDAPIGNLSLDRLRYFPPARRPPLPSPSAPLQPRVLIGISGFYGTLGLDNAGTSDIGDRR